MPEQVGVNHPAFENLAELPLDPIADDIAKQYKSEKAHYDAIQAIEQENPRDGRRFRFVAVAKAKKLLFDDLIQAAAWLDGVHHGMQQASDKPVMVRRPYETEATPVDDATDLTVAT